MIDREHEEALRRLKIVFDDSQVSIVLIGALVLRLHYGSSARTTYDADFAVGVESWEQFDDLKKHLLAGGFRQGREPHRLEFGENVRIDLIPFGKKLIQNDRLKWPGTATEMNLAGYDLLLENAQLTEIAPGIAFPAVVIPLFVVLKIVTYQDRLLATDLADILFCLEHYEEDASTSRRFECIGKLKDLDWDSSGAYLLGRDARKYLGPSLNRACKWFFENVLPQGNRHIASALREMGVRLLDEEQILYYERLVQRFSEGLKD